MFTAPARRSATLAIAGVAVVLVLTIVSVAQLGQPATKWAAVAAAAVAAILVAVRAESRGTLLALASVALAGTTLATTTEGDALNRGIGAALVPCALALAALSIRPGRSAGAAVLGFGAVIAGPVRALFYDPFLDASCAACRHSALAILGDYERAVELGVIGWLFMAIGAGMLVVGSTRKPAVLLIALLAAVGSPGIVIERGTMAAVAVGVGAVAGILAVVDKVRTRRLLLGLDGVHDDWVPSESPQAMLAREEQRLTALLAEQVRELGESRARVVRRADDERRRLERDLHDGAQQHVLALGFDLRTALAGHPDARSRAALERCLALAVQALDDLRTVSHGVYPALLSVAGLGPALRALDARSGEPIRVGALPERMPTSLERASYLLLAEIRERAEGTVVVEGAITDGRLRLGIRCHPIEPSRLMRERISALGGTLVPDDGGWTLDLPCG